MKKIKKLLALAMAMCMIFSMTTIVFADETSTPVQFGYRGAAMDVEIAAGTAVSYYEYGVGGMELVVTGENAYVVFAETKYEAVDGTVSVLLAGGNPRMPVDFTIGNSGTEAATFTVDFAYPEGSMSNPYVLEEAGYISADIAEGNSEGYWITYTAPEAGTLTVEIYNAYDAEYNTLGWTYVVNQMTACKYGDTHTSADDEVVSLETFEVNAGDEIQVMMSTFDAENPWTAPAGTVAMYFTLVTPTGTMNNPIQILDTTVEQTVEAGSTVYYQAYFAGMIMTIENENVSVVYNGDTYVAEDGVITVEFPASMSMGRPMPEKFQIINDGTEDVTVTIKATYPEGHMENPKVIEAGKYTAEITEGSNGYYYTWTAPSAGELTVAVSSDKGWIYSVNNLTTYKYGDSHYYDEEVVVLSETITVAEGDEIQIMVITADADAYYAAVEGKVNVDVIFESDKVVVPPTDDDTTDDDTTTGTENNSPSTDDTEVKSPSTGDTDVKSPSTSDTELENKVNASVSDKDAVLEVSKPFEEALNAVAVAGKDLLKDKLYEVLELDLFKNGVQLTQLKDKVQVTLSVFDKIKDAKWINVYRYNEETKVLDLVTEKPVEVKDGRFTFETDHFSTYVFVAADAPTTEGTQPDTSDNAPIAAMVAIAALAATAAVVVSKKKAEEM